MFPARMTMFCMVFNLLSGARDHPFDKTRQKPVGRRLHGWAKGPAGNPRGAGVERAGRFAANTARTGAGLRAGNRTGLGDCQSKGRCLNQATGRGTQADEFNRPHPAQVEPSRKERKRSPRPHMPPAPPSGYRPAPRRDCSVVGTPNSTQAPDFKLEAESPKNCRSGRRFWFVTVPTGDDRGATVSLTARSPLGERRLFDWPDRHRVRECHRRDNNDEIGFSTSPTSDRGGIAKQQPKDQDSILR